MDTAIARQLVDKLYEKRKAAALDLEKQIRECHAQGDIRRITQIIDQLVEMFGNSSNPLHIRNGGLIGLAGTSIALGVDVAPYMHKFVEQLLVCFTDPENRIRYFAAECLYNIAKVSKGEILVYFNPIFDALSKLAADSESSVKNGADLLDRLLKDIVAESASVYIPQYAETERVRAIADQEPYEGVLVNLPDSTGGEGARRAFSLQHFIPLLVDRIYVVSPFTRGFLVSWINVLDSVPELELISYLPLFLEGLLRYLSDPTEDVRSNTETVLGEFIREIRDISTVRKKHDEDLKTKRVRDPAEQKRRAEETLPDITMSHTERAVFIPENEDELSHDGESTHKEDLATEYRETGAWIPGQGVNVDYTAIVDILINQMTPQHDEIQQSTALRWLAEFLTFAQDVMVPFTPRLVRVILPNLAHHVAMIQSAANRTNKLLLEVIKTLPSPTSARSSTTNAAPIPAVRSPTPTATATAPAVPSRGSTLDRQRDGGITTTTNGRPDVSSPEDFIFDPPDRSVTPLAKTRGSESNMSRLTDMPPPPVPASALAGASTPSRPQSPSSFTGSVSVAGGDPPATALPPPPPEDLDLFDYQETVTALTVQFISEFEETRVAAFKWLLMLHQKAPNKILAMDDGTFPALLKTLSDNSDEVIKHDLQLLAQISSSSEENYFKAFMINLLELFSTDRRLLDTRGSLIIRQLCVNLNTERIYRTFAEILEKEDDLEFASVIVQKLNIILITSPELADFRKRLKSLETRQDGQALFTTLYRSWCHNAVAVFSLCLLAQAYEHASNLLYIFADLEITVHMLVQVDKLVQLIESPVFTYLRLQLLEPERYPHLFKCLYGLLMLLPQSSAFVSLRNRLNAVNSAGFLHIAPKSTMGPLSTRSKLGRDEIKWQELLLHFRSVQNKHEKARRLALGPDVPFFSSNAEKGGESLGAGGGGSGASSRAGPSTPSGGRPPLRRKVTGGEVMAPPPAPAPPRNVLSPLNPRARGLLATTLQSPPPSAALEKQRRAALASRKP